MKDRLAISAHAALRTLYNAGHNTEEKLIEAQKELKLISQPTTGYYYADDVQSLVDKLKDK